MKPELKEAYALTIWSPGFKNVLDVLASQYEALVREQLYNQNMSEKEHYAGVKNLRSIRTTVHGIYKNADVEPPESVKQTFHIGDS